jgi:ADP-ribose pyrophosphatase YjhB (NUDIX family)
MNYCSHCGSDKISFRIPKGDTYQRFICDNCHTIHYQNPRVIVGCLPVYDGKILLCKRDIDPQKGLWNLPAGFMENGEKAEEGALRELYEESKATADIMKLHVLFSLPEIQQVYLHFLCKLKTAEFSVTPESSEVKLFLPEEIPWDKMAFQSSTFALKKFIEFGPDYEGVHIGNYMKKENWM